jgi:hypothetical protein
MEKKSEQSVFHTPWTEKSNNNNNNNNKKKKRNQPYMLKCGHVKKRRRVYALEKKDTEYKVKYELTMHVYSKKHTTFSVFCNNI